MEHIWKNHYSQCTKNVLYTLQTTLQTPFLWELLGGDNKQLGKKGVCKVVCKVYNTFLQTTLQTPFLWELLGGDNKHILKIIANFTTKFATLFFWGVIKRW